MKKIQVGKFKLRAWLAFLAMLWSLGSACAQKAEVVNNLSPSLSLSRADSLFKVKQYTQSLALYQSLNNKGQFSPAMLLKMAYIEEGLGHIAETQLYLNRYYLATYDPLVQNKLEDVANKNRLEGYGNTDGLRILAITGKYYFPILLSLAAVSAFLISLAAFFKYKKGIRPVYISVFLVVSLALLGLHAWFSTPANQAIIMNSTTYLMDGPSAGAPVSTILGAGHRVQVLGETDVWVRVKWGEKVVYVREGDLELVSGF